MKTLAMKKLKSTLTNPMKSRRNLFSLGMFGALDRSRIMNPKPPIVKRKLDASPSIIYCPFTLQDQQTRGWGKKGRKKRVRGYSKKTIYIAKFSYSTFFSCTNTQND